jgi:uncharacterized protein YecE (DUF72 family)
LSLIPREVRVVVEARHDSWFVDRVQSVLLAHGAALCAADRRSRVQGPLWDTAEFAYVRLHEGTGPESCYGGTALHTWLARIVDAWPDRDTYVLFNNDRAACAVRNAARLAVVARNAGVPCSRATPGDGFLSRRAG